MSQMQTSSIKLTKLDIQNLPNLPDLQDSPITPKNSKFDLDFVKFKPQHFGSFFNKDEKSHQSVIHNKKTFDEFKSHHFGSLINRDKISKPVIHNRKSFDEFKSLLNLHEKIQIHTCQKNEHMYLNAPMCDIFNKNNLFLNTQEQCEKMKIQWYIENEHYNTHSGDGGGGDGGDGEGGGGGDGEGGGEACATE